MHEQNHTASPPQRAAASAPQASQEPVADTPPITDDDLKYLARKLQRCYGLSREQAEYQVTALNDLL